MRVALEAADAGAAAHRRWIGRVGIETADAKGKADFVSRADLEAQDAVVEVIRARCPDHDVLAEEDEPDGSPPRGGTAHDGRDLARAARSDDETPVWVVDPLDGTTNFLHGHPMYAASVAVAVGGSPVAGAVSCAPTGERWWAGRGLGAWKNGRRLSTSGVSELSTALVGTGFPFKKVALLDRYLDQLGAVLRGSGGVRRGGAAALDLAYLAEGRFDAFWELDLNPWDFAAGVLLVEEAGGTVGRVEGGVLELSPGSVLGANGPALDAALREALAEA